MKKRLLVVLCAMTMVLGLVACGEYKRVEVKKTEDDLYIGATTLLKTKEAEYILDENGDLLSADGNYDSIIIRDIFSGEITYYAPRKAGNAYYRALYDAKGNKIADYGKYTYGEYSLNGYVLRAKATSNRVQIRNVGAALWNPKDDVVAEYEIFSLIKLNDKKVLALDNEMKVMGVFDSSAKKDVGFPLEVNCYNPEVKNGYVVGMDERLTYYEENEEREAEAADNSNDTEDPENVTPIEEEGPNFVEEGESDTITMSVYDSEFNLVTTIGDEGLVDFDNTNIRGDYFLVAGPDDYRICNLKDGETVFETEYSIEYFDGETIVLNDFEKSYIADKNGEFKSEGYETIIPNDSALKDVNEKADFFIAKDKYLLCTLSKNGSVKQELKVGGIYQLEGYGDYIATKGRDDYDNKIAGIYDKDLKEIIAMDKYLSITPLNAVYNDDAPEGYFYCKYISEDLRERGEIVKENGTAIISEMDAFSPIKEKYFALLTKDGAVGFMDYSGNWLSKDEPTGEK